MTILPLLLLFYISTHNPVTCNPSSASSENVPQCEFRMTVLDSTSFNMSCPLPAEYKNVKYYIAVLYWIKGNVTEKVPNRKDETVKSGFKVFDNLTPFTNYTVEVQYGYRTGLNQGAKFFSPTVQTHPPVPNPPINMSVDLNSWPVAVVRWQTPPVDEMWQHIKALLPPLQGYRVQYWLVKPAELSKANTIQVYNVTNNLTEWRSRADELVPGAVYHFDVAAYNLVTRGNSSSIQFTTPEAIPSAAPQSLQQGESVNKASVDFVNISLRWSPPPASSHNGRLLYYEVWCHQTRMNDTSATSVRVNASTATTVVEGLLEDTEYQCQVRAANSKGHGPWSAPIPLRTPLLTLPPPLNVRCLRVSSKELMLTWTLPRNADWSKYKEFRVWYSTRDDPSPTASTWMKATVIAPKSMLYINDVDASGTYVVRMASVRQNEPGLWCDLVLEEQRLPPPIVLQDVTCEAITDVESQSKLEVPALRLSWSPLVHSAEMFRVNVSGTRTYMNHEAVTVKNDFPEREWPIIVPSSGSGRHQVKILNLGMENSKLHWNTRYNVGFMPLFKKDSKLWGSVVTVECRTPINKPSEVVAPKVVSIDPQTGVFTMLLKRTSEEHGPVSMYVLLLASNLTATLNTTATPSQSSWQPDSQELTSWLARWDAAGGLQANLSATSASLGGVFVKRWSSPELLFGQGKQAEITLCRGAKASVECPLLKGFNYRAVLLACLQSSKGEDELRMVSSRQRLCTASPVSSLLNTPQAPYVANTDQVVVRTSKDVTSSALGPWNSGGTASSASMGHVLLPLGAGVVLLVLALVVAMLFLRSRRRQRRQDILRRSNAAQNPWLGLAATDNQILEDNSQQRLLMKKANTNGSSTNGLILPNSNGNGVGYLMYSRLNSDQTETKPTSPYHMKNGNACKGQQGSTTTLLVNCNSSPLVSTSNMATTAGGPLGVLCGSLPPHMLPDNGEDSCHGSSSIGTGTDLSLRPSSALASAHPPIPVSRLLEHLSELKSHEGQLFQQEYENIDPGQQFTWQHSMMEWNRGKNRYANVVAYDHSRVVLQAWPGENGFLADYINANYVSGYRRHNAYIATQGPLPETCEDFWRMVWQQRCAMIVMMTRLEERHRAKCHQYWPSRDSALYGRVEVTLLSQTDLAYYSVRLFDLHLCGTTEHRQVHQVQLTAWPDHGVPAHSIPLLLYIRRIRALTAAAIPSNQTQREDCSRPVIVHCSAGVGRTGAYVAVDAQLERMAIERSVDVYGHVTQLRGQRNYMVQTEEQYRFVYEALREALLCGFGSEVPVHRLQSHVATLCSIVSNALDPQLDRVGVDGSMESLGSTTTTMTGLSSEFAQLNRQCGRASGSEVESGGLAVNQLKNRLLSVLPLEHSRVQLRCVAGIEGSDYINANYIDGYRKCHAYIATQAPMYNTVEDFWRMVWEQGCPAIVMLTQLQEEGKEKCVQYWPPLGHPAVQFGHLRVETVSEQMTSSFLIREMRVSDESSAMKSHLIRQFHFTRWPTDGVAQMLPSDLLSTDTRDTPIITLCDALWDLLAHVQPLTQECTHSGPVIVHCSAGTGRTGVFLTLAILLERALCEDVVDLFMTVKLLRLQRALLVHTEDQYRFSYLALVHFFNTKLTHLLQPMAQPQSAALPAPPPSLLVQQRTLMRGPHC